MNTRKTIIPIILILLLLLPAINAATIYVSRYPINGYGVGNDAYTYTSVQNKATPNLTVTGAITDANAGDTIVINDGNYYEATYVLINKNNLTLTPETDYNVRFFAVTTDRVLYAFANTVTIGKIVLDANKNRAFGIWSGDTNKYGLILHGTRILDANTTSLVIRTDLNTLIMDQGWMIRTTGNSIYNQAINAIPAKDANYLISDGQIIIDSNVTPTTKYGINIAATAGDLNVEIHDVNFDIKTNTDVNITIYSVFVSNAKEVRVHDNNFQTRNAYSAAALFFANTLNVTTNNALFYNNTGDLNSNNGYITLIGSETPTTPQKINNAKLYRNNVSGSGHGLMLGHVQNGEIYYNAVSEAILPILCKGTTNCRVYYNLVRNLKRYSEATGLLDKNGHNDVFYNNTIIFGGTPTTPGTVNSVGMQSIDNSENTTFRNNLLYTDINFTSFMTITSGSTATLTNNLYYSSIALPSTAFRNGASSYASLALWKAAGHDADSINNNPLFTDYNNRNFTLQSTSPAINKGKNVGLTSDYLQRSIVSTADIGAYESSVEETMQARYFFSINGTTIIPTLFLLAIIILLLYPILKDPSKLNTKTILVAIGIVIIFLIATLIIEIIWGTVPVGS